MKKSIWVTLLLALFSQSVWGQAVYGVFTPIPNVGEKQVGTVSPINGDISLLGTNASVEDGQIDMTTGATALNVTDNKSYFIGEDNSDDPVLVDRIYTVDLLTGVTDTAPALSAGYSTSNNFGIWYDDIDDVLYGLFLIGGTTAELSTIDPSTGTVTTLIADVVGEDVDTLASGLMTGGRDNTNGNAAKRIFAFINDSVFAINLDDMESIMIEVGGASLASSRTFGLEWDNINNALWILYNPDLGERNLAKILSEDDFTEEAFVDSEFGVDGTDPITTSSGLSALDEQSGLFFFIGRPSVGPNNGSWSLYTVDVNAQSSSNVDIEDAALVQTNNYAAIEVLPGPDLTFTKSDGDVSVTPGNQVNYSLEYSNGINGGASNGLMITETVPAETTFLPVPSTAGWSCLPDNSAGSTCTISPTDVSAGGSGSVDFVIQLNSMVTADIVNINNAATLSATNAVNDLIASDTTPVIAAPVVALNKTDNDLITAIPGDTIAYDITVDNSGDREADEVVLTETVPANTFYVPTAPFTWTCVPNNLAGAVCETDPVDVGQTQLVTQFNVQVIDSVPAGTTEISNAVMVSGNNFANDTAVDTTPITSAAILTLTKTDNDTTVIPGESVTYQLDFANTGNQDAVNSTLSEIVLAQTQFDASNSTVGWNCLPDNNAGSECTFDLNTLAGGDSGSVDFALYLNSPVPGIFSQLDNTAVIDADNATAVPAQESTPVDASVALRIVKSDGEVTAGLGKIINYTLINFNEGNRDALQATLTEVVPDFTTFYPPSSTNGWQCLPNNMAGSTCTIEIGDLPGLSGKNTTFFAVRVADALDSGVTELSNTAIISAANSVETDEDTELTEVDRIIPIVSLIDTNPSMGEITSCAQIDTEVNEIIISFNDDNPGLIGIDDPMNYILIDTGLDQDLQTESCSVIGGDDQSVNIDDFVVGGTPSNPNVTLTTTNSLGEGQHVLLICDGITDAAGNALDGDIDGFTGGNLKRQFRVEFDNLFSNAYLDDCIDNPISLDNYNVIAQPPEIIVPDSTVDIDGSELSGSVYINSPNGVQVGIEQCVNFESSGSHRLSVSTSGVPSQTDDLDLFMICALLDGVDCNGNGSGPHHSEEFILTASTTPQWLNFSSQILLPEGTESAFCAFIVGSADENSFELNLDEFSMIEADLIFLNGFEAQ